MASVALLYPEAPSAHLGHGTRAPRHTQSPLPEGALSQELAYHLLSTLLQRYSLKSFQRKLDALLAEGAPDSTKSAGQACYWDNEEVWDMIFKVQQDVIGEAGVETRADFVKHIRTHLIGWHMENVKAGSIVEHTNDATTFEEPTRIHPSVSGSSARFAEKLHEIRTALKIPDFLPRAAKAEQAAKSRAEWDAAFAEKYHRRVKREMVLLLGVLDGKPRLTTTQAISLMAKLTEIENSKEWQRSLVDAIVKEPLKDFLSTRSALVRAAQYKVMPKYGFEPTEKGIERMKCAFEAACMDEDFRERCFQLDIMSTMTAINQLKTLNINWTASLGPLECMPERIANAPLKTEPSDDPKYRLTLEQCRKYLQDCLDVYSSDNGQAVVRIMNFALKVHSQRKDNYDYVIADYKNTRALIDLRIRREIAPRWGFERSPKGANGLHREAAVHYPDPDCVAILEKTLRAYSASAEEIKMTMSSIQKTKEQELERLREAQKTRSRTM